ncbi:protease complex subunit PrcB family protein [Caldilinea sp.]|uniref:protease complex subunit PrcB family protein n=1 Tax=Caldilinea sp. TaxID=2293560 RepID=UPI002CE6D7B5|nr:protease complex subunit PrcB family protein [Anaerolineales bacterium]HQY91490.1 protease complex subunit PrcB family protein [Caldilinea sp.]
MNQMRAPGYWSLLIAAALLLAGCHLSPVTLPAATPPTNGEIEIPFETVAVNESGANIDAHVMREGPQLLLLTSPNQIVSIQDQVNPETWTDLQQVDFQQYAVVALFRGLKPSTNYQTIIERITRQDDRLIVYAQFWEPNPVWESAAAETRPFHLVKIDRSQVPASSVELVLQSYVLTPTPPAR